MALAVCFAAYGTLFASKKKGQRHYRRLDSLVSKPGQSQWLEACLLSVNYACSVNFLTYWKSGESTPWLLATNLLSPQAARKTYR